MGWGRSAEATSPWLLAHDAGQVVMSACVGACFIVSTALHLQAWRHRPASMVSFNGSGHHMVDSMAGCHGATVTHHNRHSPSASATDVAPARLFMCPKFCVPMSRTCVLLRVFCCRRGEGRAHHVAHRHRCPSPKGQGTSHRRHSGCVHVSTAHACCITAVNYG